MKMSESNYKKFKNWFDYTVENATDEVIEYLFGCIVAASKVAMKNIEKEKKMIAKKKAKLDA